MEGLGDLKLDKNQVWNLHKSLSLTQLIIVTHLDQARH